MSSILKALKKLENTTGSQTSFAESVIDTKQTIRRSTLRTWLFYSVVSAMIVIGILIGGGWILLRQKPLLTKLFYPASSEEKKEIPKPEPKKTTPPPLVRTESVIAKAPEIAAEPVSDKKPESVKEPTEKKPDPPKQRVAMPEKPVIVPKPEELVIPPRPAPSRTIQDTPRSVEESQPPLPAESGSSIELSPEMEKAITDEALAEIEAAESAPHPSPADSQIPEKQIQGLGIQALVWSEDPKSRMVMMNNQILHIGDMVDRFHLKDIGSDFVVLSEGTQEWKMRFHIK
ncbi:MAG: GspB domain-containing protein [Desulfobacteraceae bacterium]|nr:GspB domain-containing protein [Desulfobacteraceae bacterium]